MPPRAQGGMANAPGKGPQTVEWDAWEGLNLSDARTAIGDTEFSWLENALTVGKGAVQTLPGPGPVIATIAAGVATLWGVVLNGNPVLIAICSDGSAFQIAPDGTEVGIAVPGALTVDAHVSIWRGSPVLFIDPVTGYSSWNGSAYVVIDPTLRGSSLAVFEGRVWIANDRLITYSAPDSYTDFTAANGGGSSQITDEAFSGNIVNLVSALEQLWVVGESAIDAISNVSAIGSPPNVTTSFSTSNIVSGIGSSFPASVLGYFRALAFFSPVGAYALSGVTPQKLSDKLDDLFESLDLSGDVPACIATVRNFQTLLFLVTYTGQNAQAAAGPTPMLLGFKMGKWFMAAQGTGLRWVTTLVVNGVAQAWGTDGADVFQLFAADPSDPTVYKVQSKLYNFGKRTQSKAATKLGFEFQAAFSVNPTFTIDSQSQSQVVPLTTANQILYILNITGVQMTLVNQSGATLVILSAGIILSRTNCNLFGNYLGWTVKGGGVSGGPGDPPYRIQAVEMEITPTREWQNPAA